MKKHVLILALSIAILAALLPGVPAQAMTKEETQSNVNTIIGNFAKDTGRPSSSVKFLVSDLNNDNSRDVVVWTDYYSDEDGDFYLGVYSLGSMKKTAFESFSSDYFGDSYIEVRTIKNPTYKNGIAVISYSDSWVSTQVYTTKWGPLKQIGSAYSNYSVNGVVLKDLNSDGSQEILGMNAEYDNGSESLQTYQMPTGKVIWKWNVNQLQYVPTTYGSDGKLDSTRKAIGSITASQAISLLTKAYNLQYSLKSYYTQDQLLAKMKPYFTYDIIYGFLQNGVQYENGFGYKPLYKIYDYNVWLLPKFKTGKVDSFDYSTDKTRVKLVQKQAQNMDGEVVTRNATAVLVKTKYGWKIDDYGYNF